MAEQKLTFTIGSTFSGKGFVAANKEIENAAKEGKKLSNALGGIINEAKELDGVWGKLAGGAASVIDGFSQLGILGGIMAGVKYGIDQAYDAWKNFYDGMVKDSEKALEIQRKALQKAVDEQNRGVTTLINNTKKSGADAVKQFDEVANAALRVSQLVAQTDIAHGQYSIAKIQVEKLNAIINEESNAGKAVIGARYDLTIATMKAKEAEETAATNTKLAQEKLDKARERVEKAQNQVALAEEAYKAAKDIRARQENITQAEAKQSAENLKRTENDLADAKREAVKSAQGVTEAEEQLKTAQWNQARVYQDGQKDVLQATLALQTVNKAEEEAAKAREKEAKAAEDAAKATREAAEKIKEKIRKQNALKANAEKDMNDIQDAANGTIAGLQNDIQNLTNEIKEINERRDRAGRGVATERGVNNWGPGYNWGLDAGGAPDNFIDWQRAMRFAERAERDRQKAERRDSQFQDKMQRLQEKLDKRGEKALSDREKAQLKAWNEFQDAKNGRERRQKEIEAKQKEIDRLRKQMADDLRRIKEDLKEALELP